jgi:tripartite-type tricarboxylate transporter receptor subunit TctC
MIITRPLRAQAMPRNITIICPFAPGGPTDLISRLMAESMGPFLDAQMVVENVTGAGGTIGAARVANARPDGAVLLMHHIGHAGAASLYRRLPYNVEESFATIGLVTEVPQMIVARPDFPANTVAELLAALRANGYGLTLGVQTRLDGTRDAVHAQSLAGNVYVNRNIIGAVVGVQPFGGSGLSGTGPKAGGPHYLTRFVTERTLTINTTATGGNTALLSIG